MLWIMLSMLGILAVAGLIVVYTAFPHRGESVPHVPWVGEVMQKGVERLPTLDNTVDQRPDQQPDHRPGVDAGRAESARR